MRTEDLLSMNITDVVLARSRRRAAITPVRPISGSEAGRVFGTTRSELALVRAGNNQCGVRRRTAEPSEIPWPSAVPGKPTTGTRMRENPM